MDLIAILGKPACALIFVVLWLAMIALMPKFDGQLGEDE